MEKDPELALAVVKARAELPSFIKSLKDRPDGEYAINARFMTARGPELLWIRVDEHKGTDFVGELTSDPVAYTEKKKGDTVTVSEAAVVDWTYKLDGQTKGAYTSQILHKRGHR